VRTEEGGAEHLLVLEVVVSEERVGGAVGSLDEVIVRAIGMSGQEGGRVRRDGEERRDEDLSNSITWVSFGERLRAL
jgi:hypothetical protein